MSVKQDIRNTFKSAASKIGASQKDIDSFQILEPSQEKFGNYATNLAFIVAHKKKKDPEALAKKLSEALKQGQNIFAKVEVAGKGFVNLFLCKEYLHKKLKEIIEQGSASSTIQQYRPQKIQVEFLSANPTGPLHLGHGRNAFYGDALANILEFAGHQVEREFYVNIAKDSKQIKELGKTILGKGTEYQSDYLKQKKKALADKLKGVSSDSEAGYITAQEILKDIKLLAKGLGIKFDSWFSEEKLYRDKAKENLLTELHQKKLTYLKDGALWLKTSQFGDEKDRVIVRSSGESTYFLSDILYHKSKIERGFKKIVDVWGADHQGHKKRMQAVMKMLGFKGEFVIPIIQMVRLKTEDGAQKMSKRKGTVVYLEDLVKEVGKDSVRFMLLLRDVSTQLVFNAALAKEKSEKNPVYYLQYALVRAKSIIKQLNPEDKELALQEAHLNLLDKKEELALIQELVKFPDVIQEIASNYEVYRLAYYSLQLAKKFHQFYKNCRVIDQSAPEQTQARIALVVATRIILEKIFDLLGISKPDKM